MRGGQEATARGPHYQRSHVRNDPPPVQARLPILDRRRSASGRRCTPWPSTPTPGTPAATSSSCATRTRSCGSGANAVGRDESEIERTLGLGLVVIRDDPADAARRVEATRSGRSTRATATSGRLGTAERDRGMARAVRPAGVPPHLLRRPGTVRRRDRRAVRRRGQAHARGLDGRRPSRLRLRLVEGREQLRA